MHHGSSDDPNIALDVKADEWLEALRRPGKLTYRQADSFLQQDEISPEIPLWVIVSETLLHGDGHFMLPLIEHASGSEGCVVRVDQVIR
jgi:hypothetical protein